MLENFLTDTEIVSLLNVLETNLQGKTHNPLFSVAIDKYYTWLRSCNIEIADPDTEMYEIQYNQFYNELIIRLFK